MALTARVPCARQNLLLSRWKDRVASSRSSGLVRCITKKAGMQSVVPIGEEIPEPPSTVTAVASMGFGGATNPTATLHSLPSKNAYCSARMPMLTASDYVRRDSLLHHSMSISSSSAIGAIGIAAVGVYGAFKMALWAAKESGRSMDPSSSAEHATAKGPPVVPPPSKAELEEELTELRKLPRSPGVDSRKAAIKAELRASTAPTA